jgi:hypothetical protein
MDRLFDLLGPGLIVIGLAVWLVRRAARAARNEATLEEQRLQAALGGPLQALGAAPGETAAALRAAPEAGEPEGPPLQPARAADPLAGADLLAAAPEHVQAIAAAVAERTAVAGAARVEVLWIRSAGPHVAWGERRLPAATAGSAPGLVRELICVARVEDGQLKSRSIFG